MYITRRVSSIIASFFTLLLFVHTAHGGGFHFPDLGTVGLSRGGAFVAKGSDPTAIYYNPAAATRLKGTHLLVNTNIVTENISFQRKVFTINEATGKPFGLSYPHDPSKTMPLVENYSPTSVAPFIAFTSDLGFLDRYNMVLLGGLYVPNAIGQHRFPRYCKEGSNPCIPTDESGIPSPNRYGTVGMQILMMYPSLGLAWEPIEGLSIGGVFQLGIAHFIYKTAASPLGNETDSPAGDIDQELDVKPDPIPTGILGIHYRPFKFLEFGASFRFGMSIKANGEVCMGERNKDGSCQITDKSTEALEQSIGFVKDPKVAPNPADASLEVDKQWILRTGVRYVHHDAKDRELFDVELDFVYEGTSSVDQFTLKMDPAVDITGFNVDGEEVTFTSIDEIVLPHKWKDSFSLRLGGSYHFYDLWNQIDLSVRGGALYHSAAVDDQFIRLNFLPLEKYGLSTGFGLKWDRYRFDVGYMFLYAPEKEVGPAEGEAPCANELDERDCGSKVTQIAPVVSDRQGSVIGNGIFNQSVHQVNIGISAAFN